MAEGTQPQQGGPGPHNTGSGAAGSGVGGAQSTTTAQGMPAPGTPVAPVTNVPGQPGAVTTTPGAAQQHSPGANQQGAAPGTTTTTVTTVNPPPKAAPVQQVSPAKEGDAAHPASISSGVVQGREVKSGETLEGPEQGAQGGKDAEGAVKHEPAHADGINVAGVTATTTDAERLVHVQHPNPGLQQHGEGHQGNSDHMKKG